MLRKISHVGSTELELVSIDGGKCYVWPEALAAKIHASAQERRRLIFNAWPRKKKAWRQELKFPVDGRIGILRHRPAWRSFVYGQMRRKFSGRSEHEGRKKAPGHYPRA